MSGHKKTLQLIETAAEILGEQHPMTVRQVFYRLVSRQVIENNQSAYQAVSKALVAARRDGSIRWGLIEDRLRKPRSVSMWDGLGDFAATAAAAYRRDVWADQPAHLEVWLEKDALSGIFEDTLDLYGVTLNVGRGFDGWSLIHDASQRLDEGDAILYFGDFDPSGEDMMRSLRARRASLGSHPEIIKCALTHDDVRRYDLPADFTKATDTRSAAFVRKWGDMSVELDALPVDVLRDRIVGEVESRMDFDALDRVRSRERDERRLLADTLATLA